MTEFIKDLDELLYLSTQKKNLSRHLEKNYKNGIHYIITKIETKIHKRGGQNKNKYMLTEKTFELFKNSFNLRNKYIVDITDNIEYVNSIGMCIENQTIGFIENTFKDVLNIKRQYTMGKYRVDLYFIDYKLVIECDEYNHKDRDIHKEKIREDYIISLGNKIIRYNPNESNFDLSNVLREINKVLF
jgi:very-short-patch-repair endonuclease